MKVDNATHVCTMGSIHNANIPGGKGVYIVTEGMWNKILYIGKAGSSLSKRLNAFFNQGTGAGNNHKGGIGIFNVFGWKDMNVYVCPADSKGKISVTVDCGNNGKLTVSSEKPELVESWLIRTFELLYGKLPYANKKR